jgi:P27 family predicted phage terminase small subunit
MKGPRPKPAALKRLEGNPGKRKIKEGPRVAAKVPRCPAQLEGEARREWYRLARQLVDAGIATQLDRSALAIYCQAWGEWCEAVEHLNKGERTFTTDSGYQQQTPWVGMARAAAETMRKFMAEFGLTPSSRSRLPDPDDKTLDPFQEFMQGKFNE